MKYIDNNCIEPYFNLALEEYLLRERHEEFFVLWRDEPCVVVGKNQNTLSEINLDYVNKNAIKVVRRQTGGGTVFHDLGNLNFTFIVNDREKSFNDFYKFAKPIIGVLEQLGIKAEFSGRNDILIEGKKISGNAQCKYKNRVMHHGTLLFSSDITNLSEALVSKPIKFSDKAVKSVSSRVTNISGYLKDEISVLKFKDLIFKYITKNQQQAVVENLKEEEVKKVEQLVKDKYETWQWNFGKSPKYNFSSEKKFSGGLVETRLQVEGGVIKEVRIFGDFFSKSDVKYVENALLGLKHYKEDISQRLNGLDISNYFCNISKEELLEVLL